MGFWLRFLVYTLRFSALSLVLAILLSLPSEIYPVYAQSGNLVGNAGFESGVPTTPSPLPFPWAPYPSNLPASQAGGERTGAHTGCCNGHLTPSANVPALYQYIPVTSVPSSGAVTPYQKYKLDVWVRTHVIDASIAWWTNGTGTVRCDPTVKSPGYVLKTCEFVLPGNTPAGSDKFHVNAWTSGNGWVTIDDWSLTRVPPSGLPNAIGVKNVVAFGSQADIAWADPPLNGGQWVYHRTGIRNTISDYFGEVGWQKKSDGTFVGLVAWLNPSTGMVDHQEFSYVPGQTYNFATQYYPQTGEYLFFYNYTVVAQKYIGFSSSMNVFSGGEVADALESMGNVLHSNNHNVFQGGGGFYALPYGSHYKQVSSPYPYDIIDINANTWRSTGYD